MTIREYTLNLLEECGCNEKSYRNITVEQAVADVKEYEKDHGVLPFSAEDIGRELVLICNHERLEPLPPPRNLADDFNDWGSWGVGDIYEDVEKIMRDVIASGERFDSGWHEWKKELQGMRIQRTEDAVIVDVSEYMDDLEDYAIIRDCLTDEDERRITDEQFEAIENALNEMFLDFVTETEDSESLPVTATYEEIMEKAGELMDYCGRVLKESFHLCIGITLSELYSDMDPHELDKLICERIDKIG